MRVEARKSARRVAPSAGASVSGGRSDVAIPRLALATERDHESAALVSRLLDVPQRVLPQTYSRGDFVFSLKGARRPDGTWQASPVGRSLPYGAITALGLLRLPEESQRAVLEGQVLRAMGHAPRIRFATGPPATVQWYAENRDWWEELKRSRAGYSPAGSARREPSSVKVG